MPHFNYVFGVLRTGQVLDSLPLSSVSMTRVMNGVGTMQATMSLDMSGRSNADLVAATEPGKCYIVVEREDVPIWGGIITARVYQSQAKVMQLTAQTFEVYADKRRITTSFAMTTEQRNIFRQLWIDLQADTNGNIGVTVPSSFSTAVTKELSVGPGERKTYLTAMETIADGDNGFDWTIDVQRNILGGYSKTLQIGYPTLGNQEPSRLQFEYPGVITNYYATDIIVGSGTHVSVIGEGEGTAMLTSTYIHQTLLDTGQWCRFDVDISKKFLDSQAAVDAHAGMEGPKRRVPMTVVKIFILGEGDPEFGGYGLGDACELVIKDPRFPDALVVDTRIVAWNHKPSSDDSKEEVELIFVGDELNQGS